MRTVIVSGGSSGIGEATVARFAAAGDAVINVDVNPPRGHFPAHTVRWSKVDVADWNAVRDAVDEVYRESGRVDVVVANAGISLRRSVLELDEASVRHVINVNLLGVLSLWRHAAAHMVSQGHGVLLATASVNGIRGYPLYADYNATKAGIAALCRSFAMELSPRIRTACVTPGAVLTPMQLAEYTPAMLEDVNSRIPARRHALPAEIAEMFYFLASPAARFITGQELIVDGGETAGATTTTLGQPSE